MTEESNHEALMQALGALRESIQGPEAALRVEDALLRAYRQRYAAKRRSWPWRAWRVAAVAAAVLIALLTLIPRPEQPVEPMPVSAREFSTEYMPMSFSEPLMPEEFVHVVRISVPRSELVRFGLPAEPGAGGARVTADVVLGEDGVARAIRFVR